MSDLVQRLRQVGAHHWYEHDGSAFCYRCRTFAADWKQRPSTPCQPDVLMAEAADEIERLRTTADSAEAAMRTLSQGWRAHCEQAERERDEARAEIERLRKEKATDAWHTGWQEAVRRMQEAERERDEYVSAVKEYFDAIVNHGLARERTRAANDRADHLYSAWARKPTDELAQRREENLKQCLAARDAQSLARHREEAAREALGALLIATTIGSHGSGEVRSE